VPQKLPGTIFNAQRPAGQNTGMCFVKKSNQKPSNAVCNPRGKGYFPSTFYCKTAQQIFDKKVFLGGDVELRGSRGPHYRAYYWWTPPCYALMVGYFANPPYEL
jgi:hypothetical protein